MVVAAVADGYYCLSPSGISDHMFSTHPVNQMRLGLRMTVTISNNVSTYMMTVIMPR
jgi:hypothetical protein